MMAGSHVVVGLAAWAWAAPRLGLPVLAPEPLVLVIAGALLPDIDHPKSWVGRRARCVARPIAAMLGHRGFTHSLLAVALCVALLQARGVGRMAWEPLAVGYLSHLAADLITPAGLRLAWPLRCTVALPLCRAGSPAERFIVILLVAVIGFRLIR
jgi:inner membrane protein